MMVARILILQDSAVQPFRRPSSQHASFSTAAAVSSALSGDRGRHLSERRYHSTEAKPARPSLPAATEPISTQATRAAPRRRFPRWITSPPLPCPGRLWSPPRSRLAHGRWAGIHRSGARRNGAKLPPWPRRLGTDDVGTLCGPPMIAVRPRDEVGSAVPSRSDDLGTRLAG